MTVEIISWSISTKVWDRAGIELATPGIAVSHASVARHVTDYATWPGFHADMVTPIDTGDLYGEYILLLGEIILRIVDFSVDNNAFWTF